MITPFDLPIVGSPLMLAFCGVLLIVLRAGASRVFFDVVGAFQADKMIKDAGAAATTLEAVVIDGLSGMQEAGAMIVEQMEQIIEATVPLSAEIERATIEFEKFIDLSQTGADTLAAEVTNVGLQFGFTATEALDAGARMAQLATIIGQDTIPAATEVAFAFGLIGDMTPEEAMTKLINLQQQTNFLFDETSKASFELMSAEQKRMHVAREMQGVVNQLNSIEDKSAATMAKITRTMNEFAAQGDLAGESIANMAAMSAVLIEAGEESGKAGVALRMTYGRLGADIDGAAGAIEQLGVATRDAETGGLRPLSEILRDLNPQWQTMTTGQKQAIAQQVAGNRHYVRFLKLAENFDRMQQLQQEAAANSGAVFDETGEAIGFLNDMMEAQSTQLDEARAKLEMANAAMGDIFIPGVVSATEFQAEFNAQLAQTIGALEEKAPVLSTVFSAQQKWTATLSPLYNAYVNIKAMSVAMSLMVQIMRSLNGVQLHHTAATRAHYNMQITNQEKVSNMLIRYNGLTQKQIEAKGKQKIADINNSNTEIGNLQKRLNKLDSVNVRHGRKIGLQRIDNSLLEQARQRNNALALAKEKLAAVDVKRYSRNINFRNLEKKGGQEAIAAINLERAASEGLELAIEDLAVCIQREIDKRRKRIMLREQELDAMGVERTATKLNTGETQKNTIATKAATAGKQALNMQLMKAGMGFMALDMGIMMFSDSLDEMGGEGTAARLSMISMTAIMGIMIVEIGMSAAAMSALGNEAVEAGVKIKGVEVAGKGAGVGMGAAAAGTWSFNTALKALGKTLVIGAVIGAAMFAIERGMKHLGIGSSDAADEFDYFNETIGTTASELGHIPTDIDLAAGIQDATDAMHEFAGAREEMFFGFKAGNVTGDLVKQVQQTGVENFVQNTEVIMTNNFNGLTTQEVADQILDEIERGGKARGISLGA